MRGLSLGTLRHAVCAVVGVWLLGPRAIACTPAPEGRVEIDAIWPHLGAVEVPLSGRIALITRHYGGDDPLEVVSVRVLRGDEEVEGTLQAAYAPEFLDGGGWPHRLDTLVWQADEPFDPQTAYVAEVMLTDSVAGSVRTEGTAFTTGSGAHAPFVVGAAVEIDQRARSRCVEFGADMCGDSICVRREQSKIELLQISLTALRDAVPRGIWPHGVQLHVAWRWGMDEPLEQMTTTASRGVVLARPAGAERICLAWTVEDLLGRSVELPMACQALPPALSIEGEEAGGASDPDPDGDDAERGGCVIGSRQALDFGWMSLALLVLVARVGRRWGVLGVGR